MLGPERISSLSSLSARRLLVGVAVVITVTALAGACTGGEPEDATAATTTTRLSAVDAPTEALPVVTLPEGFVVPDTRNALLPAFESRPRSTPPLPVYGGTSRLRGVVTGPDGPVEGATVRIERVIGDRVGAITVNSGAGGVFGADRLLGGHYRARAWQPPTLATTRAAVTFLPALEGSAELNIEVERFTGRQLQAVLDTADPTVGSQARVRALFTEQTVDDNGVVVGRGLSGAQVRLSTDGGFAIREGGATTTTNSEGIASWLVECVREGVHSVTVSTEAETTRVTLPACGPRPTTTTTTTTEPDDLEVPDFPVGEEFAVPYSGIVPAGVYRTFLDECETTYQVYLDGEWQSERRTSTNEIRLTVPARDFRPAAGTDGCRYQRSS
jgi:hypothetical protein